MGPRDRRTITNKITIQDIASMAGVSKATVSRALNNRGEVSAKTRQRIRALAEAAGYHMDARARSLASQNTDTIGLVIPRTASFIFANPYFSQLIQAIGEQLDKVGYHLLMSTTPDPLAFIRLVQESRVDGLIVAAGAFSSSVADVLNALAAQQFPLVVINDTSDRIDCPAVTVDHGEGLWRAVRYLIEQDHRRIAFIASPSDTMHGRERRRAYIDALREHEVPEDADLIVTGDDTEHGGKAAIRCLIERATPFTALVASNDLMAIGAMIELQDRGRRVPDDVAVVGFDDIRLASWIRPSLTTIRQPVARIGQVAAGILIDRLRRPDQPLRHDQVRLGTELVIRQST